MAERFVDPKNMSKCLVKGLEVILFLMTVWGCLVFFFKLFFVSDLSEIAEWMMRCLTLFIFVAVVWLCFLIAFGSFFPPHPPLSSSVEWITALAQGMLLGMSIVWDAYKQEGFLCGVVVFWVCAVCLLNFLSSSSSSSASKGLDWKALAIGSVIGLGIALYAKHEWFLKFFQIKIGDEGIWKLESRNLLI